VRGSRRTGMWRGQSPAQRSAVRRQQLLAAGLEVFGTSGWQQSTVRGLCAAAGLSERYFYESFTSRDELLLAVYDDLNEREFAMFSQAARHRLDGIASTDDQTLMAVLHDALLAWFATFKADPRVARVRLIEVLGVSAQIDERYRAHNRRIADLIREVSALSGHVDETDTIVATVTTGLVGAATVIATDWYLSGFQLPLNYVIAAAEAIFRGVLVESREFAAGQRHP
jgi:AcrR family transcriptional regulator